MKGIYLTGLAIACCLAMGLASTSSSNDREVRELSKRVETLERSQKEVDQTVSRLAKSVVELEKSVRSNERPTGDLRNEMNRGDKRLGEIEKRLVEVSKTVNDLQKQVAPRGDLLTATNKKIDGRTMQLAKWLDEYHSKHASFFHRDEIERIR